MAASPSLRWPPEVRCEVLLFCSYFLPVNRFIHQRFQLIPGYLSVATIGKIINSDNFIFDCWKV